MPQRPLEEWEEPEPDDDDDSYYGDNDEELCECPSCGESVYEDCEKCPHCGDYITPVAPATTMSGSRWIVVVALVLAVLMALGAFFAY